mmetsp:Transcript_12517/g.26399  ORF Transcript_12517/g.26399 Transcript_12517/m.26399 type:complete len:95 (-) Transcript_12517:158-442(-)
MSILIHLFYDMSQSSMNSAGAVLRLVTNNSTAPSLPHSLSVANGYYEYLSKTSKYLNRNKHFIFQCHGNGKGGMGSFFKFDLPDKSQNLNMIVC